MSYKKRNRYDFRGVQHTYRVFTDKGLACELAHYESEFRRKRVGFYTGLTLTELSIIFLSVAVFSTFRGASNPSRG